MRAGRQFENSRKLGNAHQYLYVFIKGDPKRAARAMPNVRDVFPAKVGGNQLPVEGDLVDQFDGAPCDKLDARAGWWQARKQQWLSLGIESEIGRGKNLLRFSDTVLQPDPEKRAEAQKRKIAAPPAAPAKIERARMSIVTPPPRPRMAVRAAVS